MAKNFSTLIRGNQGATTVNFANLTGAVPTWNQNTTGTAAGLSTTLVVSSGGTGATSLTGILKGNGTNAVTTVTSPSGDVVGTSDSQTLTNKTITAIANFETKVALLTGGINLTLGNWFTITIASNISFTISNAPSTGTVTTFVLEITNGGAGTITWWTGLKWVNGVAPTLTTSGRDTLGFYSHDGGATWSGLVMGKDIK